MRLTIALPAYDEIASLEGVVCEARDVLATIDHSGSEILIVDDGSTDGTSALADQLVARYPGVRVVHHPTNRGFSGAMRTSFRSARGEWIFLAAADGQTPMAELPGFLASADGADIVVGVRAARHDGRVRTLLSRGFHVIAKALLGLPQREFSSALLFRKALLDAMPLRSDGRAATILPEILFRARARGGRIVELPITQRPRRAGRAKGGDPSVIVSTLLRLLWLAIVLRVDEALAVPAARRRAIDDAAFFGGLALGAIVVVTLFSEYRGSILAGGDFGIIWSGPRALLDGANPYDPLSWTADRLRQGMAPTNSPVYAYPPWVAVALLPLGALPFDLAAIAWTVFGIACAASGLRAVLRTYAPGLPVAHALIPFALLASQPGVATFFSGQFGFVLVGAIAAVALFARSDRPLRGALSSLVLLAKPQYFVLWGWALLRTLVVRRQYLFVGATVAGAIGVLVASLAIGRGALASWFGAVGPIAVGDQTATTLPAALGELFGPPGIAAAVAALFVGLALGLRFDPRGGAWLAVWIPLSSLAATYARSYDQVVLLPSIAIAAGIVARRSRRGATVFVAVTAAIFSLGSILLYALAAARGREDTSVALTAVVFGLVVASLWPDRRDTSR